MRDLYMDPYKGDCIKGSCKNAIDRIDIRGI